MADDDQRVDALLRDWARSSRAEAPPLAGRIPERRPPRRVRSWAPMLAAAVVVLALAGALTIGRAGREDRAAGPSRSTGAPSPSTSTTNPRLLPDASQQVTYHHLAVTVPSSWKINDNHCGSPASDTVLIPGAVASCSAGRKPGITWVEFRSDARNLTLGQGAQSRPTRVDGHPATRIDGSRDGVAETIVYVPSAQAAVLIGSPSRASVRRLVEGLRVVDRDSRGCPVEQAYRPLDETPRSPIAGTDGSLVPGDPEALVVCAYEGDLLTASGAVPRDELDQDLALLRELPRGLSRVPPNTVADSVCTAPETPHANLDRDGGIWFALRATYPSGATLMLHARLGFCGDLGISNGTRTAQWSFPLARLLTGAVPIGMGFAGDARPIP